ncbi:hypothetical protein N665_0400s0014 [Sinapis alba]|nr:hypothetical protein N665_0400s0014 [Sinapis alba]
MMRLEAWSGNLLRWLALSPEKARGGSVVNQLAIYNSCIYRGSTHLTYGCLSYC